MFRLVVLACFVALVASQGNQYNNDPRTAAILTEQRYQSGDGTFGSAYTQEDGVDFKEESDADGNRKGSYSYVDPTGQRRTVSYTAGKNGFQASGDHLPVGPAPAAAPAPRPQYQPQPQYNPAPQYQQSRQEQYDDGEYRPDQYDQPQPQQYRPQPQQYRPQPQQYQPQPQQYQPQPQQYRPQPQQYQPQQQQYQPPPQQYQTTAAPHRFYPPGKLSLSRTPDGFNYSFNKA